MSFLRRVISFAAASSVSGGAPARAAVTVGELIRRRGRAAVRRAAAELAPASAEESNEDWPEARAVPAAPPEFGGLPSVRRETTVQSPVSEPRGVAGNGRALDVGIAPTGKLEVSRGFHERIESRGPQGLAEESVSNPDAKDLSVREAGETASLESPAIRPASSFAARGAALPPSAVQPAMRKPAQAAVNAGGERAAAAQSAAPTPDAGAFSSRARGEAIASWEREPAPAAVSVRGERVAAAQPEAPTPEAGAFSSAAPGEAVASWEREPAQAAPGRSPHVFNGDEAASHLEAQSRYRAAFEPEPADRHAPAESQPATAAEPTVHIGSIEVVIEAGPEPRAGAARSDAARDLSSRLYLRGL